MPEMHLTTGAYALDALDDVERRAMDRHLRGCPECTEELREFQEVAAMLAERVAAQPPDSLRAEVLSGISRTRQLSPDGLRLPRVAWRGVLTAAAAVLVAFAAGISGIAWEGHRTGQQAQAEADQMARIFADPGRAQAQGRPSTGGSAVVYASGGQAVFAADRMPAAPTGKTYQLWVINGKVIRSAGLLTLRGGTGRALISDVPTGSRVAVSVEPHGGSTQPTTKPILNLEPA